MKKNPRTVGGMMTILALTASLVSCRKETFTEPDMSALEDSKPKTSVTASNMDLPGRTLAANCFQCHGTNGVAGELKIAGESASEIISELNEMRAKDPRSNIMNVHALAYTPDEIKLIADYFSKQTN